ncbi:MAG: aminotransferase class I/II-fold pyridoxal phosphate-dependent enzyme [SAR324 cluster bacterium]|nr:aminotransferase class I/II-fold pyridoxal phosphate-dependent enzyme [SAR324 cluster bacterium]
MNNFLNEEFNLSNYDKANLTKWSAHQEGAKMLPFWVADMDFMIAPAIKEALLAGVKGGRLGYGNVPEELNKVVCERLDRIYGWQVQPSEIIWKMGIVPFLCIISRTFAGLGGEVVVPTPVYYHLFNAPDWGGQRTIRIPFTGQGNTLDFDWVKIESTMKKGVKIFSLCNPHNPGGIVFKESQLNKLGDLCEKYDVLICSDEIHCDLILDENTKHTPIASLNKKLAARTLTLMSPSKSFNLAGLGASFCVVQNKAIHQKLTIAARGILHDPPTLGYRAALAAYKSSDWWLKELIIYLISNRDLVIDFFKDSSFFEVQVPHEATYLAWIESKKISTDKLMDLFLKAGLCLSNGKIFDGDKYFRLNFGCHKKTLLEGLQLIKKSIAKF